MIPRRHLSHCGHGSSLGPRFAIFRKFLGPPPTSQKTSSTSPTYFQLKITTNYTQPGTSLRSSRKPCFDSFCHIDSKAYGVSRRYRPLSEFGTPSISTANRKLSYLGNKLTYEPSLSLCWLPMMFVMLRTKSLGHFMVPILGGSNCLLSEGLWDMSKLLGCD